VLDGLWGIGTPERQAAQQESDAIRKAGFATSAGEVDAGVWGCSVPLFGASRQAVGAITLMAPIMRASGQEEALIRMAVVAAARISRQLVLH
jgi:DNA-binding IclR family transcriptional regulator